MARAQHNHGAVGAYAPSRSERRRARSHFSEREAFAAARRLLHTFGDHDQLQLLRMGNNAVFRNGDTVLRVARPGARPLAHLQRELDLAAHLAAQGVPVVEPAHPHVLSTGAHTGSLWRYEQLSSEAEVAPEELAELLGHFHDAAQTFPGEFPEFERLERVSARMRQIAPQMAPADLAVLQHAYDELDGTFRAPLSSELGYGVIHGDAHGGNSMATARGPVLCDLESACWGPREWDLVPTAVQSARFERPREEYERFSTAYGFDVTAWPGWRAASRLRLLSSTTWCLSVHGPDSEEGRRRLDYWRDGDDAPRWRAL